MNNELMEELIIDDGYHIVQTQIEVECPLIEGGTRTFERMTGGRLLVRCRDEHDIKKIACFLIVNGRNFSYAFQCVPHVEVGR